MRALAVVAVLAACSDSSAPSLGIDRAEPAYGPLVGGTVVTLYGSGFRPTNRVLVAGHEAPLAHAIDDSRIELVIPPGDRAGDAEVVVLDTTGTATARGVFRYSAPPSIASVTPADVLAASPDTVVTVHGSGFLDEDAGDLVLVLGGQLVEDVTIVDDTTLTFVAPVGRAFVRPQLAVSNARGRAIQPRAFRYTPGVRPGLLLFPRWGGSFAVFYDPIDRTTTPVPALPGSSRFRSVTRDADGVYWAIDVNDRIGRLDLEAQTITASVPTSTRIAAVTRVGDRVVGLARYFGGGGRFGALDAATGQFTPVGNTTHFCCGAYGIAFDGATVWFTARQDASTVYLSSIDPMSGVVGTPVTLAGGTGFRVEELRAWRGTLYSTSNAGLLVALDPDTGVVTPLTPAAERYSALEVFE